jgi:hypothetical protein
MASYFFSKKKENTMKTAFVFLLIFTTLDRIAMGMEWKKVADSIRK